MNIWNRGISGHAKSPTAISAHGISSLSVSHRRTGLRIRQRIAELENFSGREVGEWQLIALPPFLHLARDTLRLLSVHSGVPAEIDGLRREGKTSAGCVHNVHDPQQNVFPDGKELIVIAGKNVGEDFQAQCAFIESDKTVARAFGF